MRKNIKTTTSVKKNIILSTLYQILTLLIPFITAPYVSRVLGADGVGIYSYTSSIQLYFSMFAALGTYSYGFREIARARKSRTRRSKLFWEIELLSIFTSSVCLAIWGILIACSGKFRIFYLILTLNIINTMLDISWFYAGLEQFKYTLLQNSVFKILGVILLFIFIKKPSDLKLYVFIMSLTSLLGTMSMWLYLPKFIKKVKIKNLRIFSHLKETLVYFIPTIATSIYTVLDKTLIGIIATDIKENGYYEQTTKILNMMKALTSSSLNAVLGSRIAYLFVEEKYDEIHKRIEQSINYIFFLGFGMMFGLMGIADLFVPMFFGKGYDKVIILLRIMSPLILIIGISNCLGSQYYNPAGLRAKSAKFIICGSCINLVANLIFIPKFWSYGACIGTIIAESAITILYVTQSNGFLTFKKILKIGWKKFIAGAIMLGVIFLVSLINLSRMPLLIMEILIGFVTYIIILTILRDDSIKFIFDRVREIFLKKIKKEA